MTSRWERPTSAWPLGAWIMVGILVIVVGLGISTRTLSPGLLLDGIALWPGLVPALVAALVVAIRRGWRRRIGAIPPLFILTWIFLTGAAHLGGWVALPSSAGELIGPESSPGLATMNISTDGRLLVEAAANGHLYEVRYLRLGGAVGVPEAIETTTETALNISVSDGGTTQWFSYAGWRLRLDQPTEWNLSLDGTVTGDLSPLALGSLTLLGDGTLTLGSPSKAIPVSVMGDYTVNLPAGVAARVAARVSGNVQTPESWSNGTSATPGEGWIFSVAEGGSLRINQP